MIWKMIKFLLKLSLIALGLYFGFWIIVCVGFGVILFKGLMSGIETATGPSGRYYDDDRYV